MLLCLLSCNLFPQQRDKLRRQRKRSHCVVGLWCLFLAVPDRLINGQSFPVNVRQFQAGQFPGSQTRLSCKPIKNRWSP